MLRFASATPLEAAVLESGRFELATDTAGRDLLLVGHRRLPKVVLPEKADGLHGLLQAVAGTGSRAFTVSDGDPWQIDDDEPGDAPPETAAEEYLVMGLRPLLCGGRPVRVAAGRAVVRLFLMPWTIPAETVGFGGRAHYVVTSARGVIGEWEAAAGGRLGVVVGVPEMWVGILDRYRRPGAELVLRSDVPVPWVGEGGLANAVPTAAGVFERIGGSPSDRGLGFPRESGGGPGGPGAPSGPGGHESWVARVPIVMVEGDVVRPVGVPDHLEVAEVPDGPWELDARHPADFSMSGLN